MKRVTKNLFEHEGHYYALWREPKALGGAQKSKSLQTIDKREALARLQRLRRCGMDWERFVVDEFGTPTVSPVATNSVPATQAPALSLVIQPSPPPAVNPAIAQPPTSWSATAAIPRPSFPQALNEHFQTKTTEPSKKCKVDLSYDSKRMVRQMRDTVLAMCPSWEKFEPDEIWRTYRFLGKKKASLPSEDRPKIDEKTVPLKSAGNHMATYLRSLVPWLVRKTWLPSTALKILEDITNTIVTPRSPLLPTLKEVRDLINQLILVDELSGLYVHLLATTGLRRGRWHKVPNERRGALGLSWTDFNERTKKLRAVMKGGRIIYVPLIDESLEVLRKLEKLTGEHKSGRIFPMGSKRASTNLKAWATTMDLEVTYLHAFRHYFATVAIQNGTPIPVVAELLGHKDGGVLLMKVYAHLIPGQMELEARKLTILTTAAG